VAPRLEYIGIRQPAQNYTDVQTPKVRRQKSETHSVCYWPEADREHASNG